LACFSQSGAIFCNFSWNRQLWQNMHFCLPFEVL
jgi:hypothetical protein